MQSARRTFAVLAALVLLAAAFPGHQAHAKARWVWKGATLAPKGVGWARQFETILIPHVRESTNGELAIKVYWGGIMGEDEDYLEKMRIGQLDSAGLAAQGTVAACPEFAVLELPFLFNSWAEVDYVRGLMMGRFDQLMQTHGFKLIAWIDQDFDQLYSTDKGLSELRMFEGINFITWYGPLEEALIDILGANPVPVAVPEAAEAVRAGQGTAMIAPAIWMVGAQLYSVIRYVNPVKLRYSPATVIVNVEAWEELPEEYQERLWDRRIELTDKYVQGTREDNRKCLEAMIQYGVREVTMSADNLEELRKRSVSVYEQTAGTLFPLDLLAEIQAHLAEFRKNPPAAE